MASVANISAHPDYERETSWVESPVFVERLRADSAITSVRRLEVARHKNGSLHRYGFTTAAGYAYNANVTVPDKPSSDIPVLSTGAWFTSPRGHNEHTVLKFMDDGLPAIIVGNEGSYRPDELIIPKRAMSLALSAGAALSFSRLVATRDFNLMDARRRTAVGESKGGMEGMGTVALARFFDQDVLMADFTAACIPRKIRLSDMREFSNQLKTEPMELARLGGRLALKLAWHYPATIDPHPYAMAHQYLKGAAVFSGEAGDLAKLIRQDQILHMTVFSGDFASMGGEWEKIFAEHKNTKITPLPGGHLTIADPETLAYVRARQQAFRQLYAARGGRLDGLSGKDVFDLAHELVDQYRSPRPPGALNQAARFLLDKLQSFKQAA